MGIERALLELEKEIAYIGFVIRCQYMTGREMAIFHNGLAMKARTQEGREKSCRDREHHERVMRDG